MDHRLIKVISATMIARGALLRALHKPTGQRILTQSYGFRRDEEYHPQLHRSAKTYIDVHEGYSVVPNRIVWLCKAVSLFSIRLSEID